MLLECAVCSRPTVISRVWPAPPAPCSAGSAGSAHYATPVPFLGCCSSALVAPSAPLCRCALSACAAYVHADTQRVPRLVLLDRHPPLVLLLPLEGFRSVLVSAVAAPLLTSLPNPHIPRNRLSDRLLHRRIPPVPRSPLRRGPGSSSNCSGEHAFPAFLQLSGQNQADNRHYISAVSRSVCSEHLLIIRLAL